LGEIENENSLTNSCTRQFTRWRLCDVRCAHILSHKRQRINCEWAGHLLRREVA